MHRTRLMKNGFLQEVIKGWYIPSRPDESSGESTIWYVSFWDFCAAYLNTRFDKDWRLSPEQSLLLHSENYTVPLLAMRFVKMILLNHPHQFYFISDLSPPCVNRMFILWHEMRKDIIKQFPKSPMPIKLLNEYLKSVDDKYVTDAYHSLSIEGYLVSRELIEKVRSSNWHPDNNLSDKEQKNALAARGYWQAFQSVRNSIQKVISGHNSGEVAWRDHGDWYRELFGSSVTAGILEPADLAGYRSNHVYIRRSMHVPPNAEAVQDLMPAFFDLLKEEKEASVRIVLGHFFFVYIHPYMDGNGRIGRFLMNVMCASGGYPWIIVPVEQRSSYMSALEEASTKQNIVPFCDFLGKLVN